ncbi:MAG: TAT-variant-translocated molybdopterin oxidoreductase [Cyclobacteriaceae bacterium]|nr:TAT-variant-translocated molybdopterin oxidoreductase [Cyclobacteriaceae bacterium]
MKDNKKTYWKGIEQLSNDAAFVKNAESEFPESVTQESSESSRRDFLKIMGFSVAAASLAACEAPVRKAIPYLNKPVDVDPGVANYYASTYLNGGDYCSVLVKTREGRPIKVSGNKLSSVTNGGTSAQVEASVLSLYDDARLRGAKSKGEASTWDQIDDSIISELEKIASNDGNIRIVSNTVLSPSTLKSIEDFKTKYPTTEHVMYDQVSMSGMAIANERSFGTKIIPSYDFSKAEVIVGVGADFLSTWGAPIENTYQYAQTRKLKDKKMSRHFQFESNLTLTGSNADYRSMIKPSEEGSVLANIYNILASKAGVPAVKANKIDKETISKAANDLWKAKGKSLVVAGSNDPSIQVVVNAINNLLGNYGSTIDLNTPVNYRKGDEAIMDAFINDASSGKVAAVIFFNANPVYDYYQGEKLAAALSKVALKISTSSVEDETASLVDYIAPDNHYLESWNDASPKKGHYSLAQPTITPIFKTRQAQSSFLIWSDNDGDYFKYLQNNWKEKSTGSFQPFWDKALHDGVYNNASEIENVEYEFVGDVNSEANAISSNYKSGDVELMIYEKSTIGNGSQGNNPLLHELPDPITKATWDNYITMSVADAGFRLDDAKTKTANVTVGGETINLPIMVQPGQASGTIGIALGYGRTSAGRVGDNIGKNIYPLLVNVNGTQSLRISKGVSVEVTEEVHQLAQTQTQNTFMGRETIIQEATLEEFKKDEGAGRFHPHVATWQSESGQVKPEELTLWKGHEYNGHHWGLTIDMNACNGCSACVVACNVENNIPMVGKQEIINRREMTWLRIDRYYSSATDDVTDYAEMEKSAENPEVVFQPMMCQHCNNAPCETVCPVAATTHSTEGLNQMVYNRCIGTRYCANNCPYKVRRFNWFKYHDNDQFADANPQMNTEIGKMVLNPDVTVRSRGVMEKCSFCVQRIQSGKLEAKKDRRELEDSDITTACAAACTAGAITFGDMNNAKSEISNLMKIEDAEKGKEIKIMKNKRAYHVLEEIGVRPNVFYLTKIRNKA